MKHVHDVAEQTRRKLEERRERIQVLDDKSRQLEAATAEFADMAKQTRDSVRRGNATRR